MLFVDNIDWLEFSFESYMECFENNKYFLKLQSDITPQFFNYQYAIIHQESNTEIGELQTKPRRNLNKSAFFKKIRIKNRYLYTREYREFFYDFQENFKFGEDYNLTRVDFCRDFEKFYKNLSPQVFIEKVMNNEFVYKCKSKPLIKAAGKKSFETVFTTEYDFTVYKKMRNQKTRYETLYIGNHKSLISKILYNKTVEQNTKTKKAHIEELHRKVFGEAHEDIYRLEFSLKGTLLNLIKKSTGEVGKLRIEDLEDVTGIIRCLINKKYKFLKYSEKKNKARDWQEVKLFTDEESVKYDVLPIKYKSNSNQSNKNFAKRMALLPLSMRDNEMFESKEVQGVMRTLYNKYLQEYDLLQYHNDKILPSLRNYSRKEVLKL